MSMVVFVMSIKQVLKSHFGHTTNLNLSCIIADFKHSRKF